MDENDQPSINSKNDHLAGLETQILNSQESLIRVNRELDSALLRNTTLEQVCSDNQTEIHEKRRRISELNDQIIEYEQTNERLSEDLTDQNEKIEHLNTINNQLKEHIKQKTDQYNEIITPDIDFNRHLRELILAEHSFTFTSPEDLLNQYQHNQRRNFHHLLQQCLITEDISQLIDSDDILFETFIHLNSLNRLKETLSRDSQHLQHIRSVLHLSIDHEQQSLEDFITKHESIEYLRSKIEIDQSMNDLELVKYVLHDYFNYQQQQRELKEYLQIENDEDAWRILLEQCERAKQIEQQQFNQTISSEENSLKEFLQSLGLTIEDKEEIRSAIDFHREKYPTIVQDYQLIVNTLQSSSTEQCIHRIETLKNTENQLSIQRKEMMNIINEYDDQLPSVDCDLKHIQQLIQSLHEFRRNIFEMTQMNTDDDVYQLLNKSQEKQDVEITEELQQVLEIDNSEQNKQLQAIFPNDNENLLTKLIENYHRLSNEHEQLNRLMKIIGDSSSAEIQLDELCILLETFYLESSSLLSTNNLTELFQQIPRIIIEYNQYQILIEQIKSSDHIDHLSKFRVYFTQVNDLCQLIGDGPISLDQALNKLQEFNEKIHKSREFEEELLKRLSIDNLTQVFTRLDELEHSLLSEQQLKLTEYEDTLEKLRSQRERMLNKMKDIKTNNETLTSQLKESEQSLDRVHREKVDLQNQLDDSQQELRRVKNQIQMNSDDYQSQVDLQETMKLEIESLQNEMDKQKKLYDNRCRQILNEKKQLEKNLQQSLDEKLLIEEKNHQTQALIQTIKDSLDNIDDVYSIVDGIIELQQDLLIHQQRIEQLQKENEELENSVHQQNKIIQESIQMKTDLDKRLIDSEQQVMHSKRQIDEHIHQYDKLKREYQIFREDHSIQTSKSKEYLSGNSSLEDKIAIIDIQQSSPPISQVSETRNWTAIEMQDEEIPSPIIPKRRIDLTNQMIGDSTMDTSTVLLNLLGELKSKLGITLTHRPRSSSVFFFYLCAVHLLTFYSLFIRHC